MLPEVQFREINEFESLYEVGKIWKLETLHLEFVNIKLSNFLILPLHISRFYHDEKL